MAVPTPRTFIDGETPVYSEWNSAIYDNLKFLLDPPKINLGRAANQSIPDNTFTDVIWDTVFIQEPAGNWSSTVNPTRITPKTPGWYRGWVASEWGALVSNSFIRHLVRKNNSDSDGFRQDFPVWSANSVSRWGLRFWMSFNGTTDYCQFRVIQNQGSAEDLLEARIFLRWVRTL